MIINDYLRDNNVTKYRFAKMCGLPYGTLNDICTRKTSVAKCSGETLMKIANAIGCTVDELLRDECLTDHELERIGEIIKPIADKHKLRSVYVFGSYARNEADENSDIDVLIDREGSNIRGLFGMNALLCELREALGRDVDVVTLQSLRQASTEKSQADFIENVMRDRVKVYG